MNERDLKPDEMRGIENFLEIFRRKRLPVAIANVISTIEEQYASTKSLTPNQIAFLYRCFKRASLGTSRYDVSNNFPLDSLNECLDADARSRRNLNKRMSDGDETRAYNYLGNMRPKALNSDVRAVVQSIEDQLLINGWISPKQLDVLRRCCLFSNDSGPQMRGYTTNVCYGR